MASHPLDNPAWHSLIGAHAGLGRASGAVRAYRPEVAIFAAIDESAPADLSGLVDLVAPGSRCALAGSKPVRLPDGFESEHVFDVLQMVAQSPVAVDVTAQIALLGQSHVAAMVELVELTQPGPFASETWRMGDYRGIFHDGRLVAMAGERMRPAGFTEISAVCTHPDFRGKGYAKQLVSVGALAIVARGETPFLHAVPDNFVAVETYRKLGFEVRRTTTATVLKRYGG